MIMEGLRVLLFGMVGIFIVMGIIILVTFILKQFGKKDKTEKKIKQ